MREGQCQTPVVRYDPWNDPLPGRNEGESMMRNVAAKIDFCTD